MKFKMENIWVNSSGFGVTDLTVRVSIEAAPRSFGIGFDIPVSWMAMPPEVALEFGLEIVKEATKRIANDRKTPG